MLSAASSTMRQCLADRLMTPRGILEFLEDFWPNAEWLDIRIRVNAHCVAGTEERGKHEYRRYRERERVMADKLCPDCGCPLLPKGVKKRPHEYDHAGGCPRSPKGLPSRQILPCSLQPGHDGPCTRMADVFDRRVQERKRKA